MLQNRHSRNMQLVPPHLGPKLVTARNRRGGSPILVVLSRDPVQLACASIAKPASPTFRAEALKVSWAPSYSMPLQARLWIERFSWLSCSRLSGMESGPTAHARVLHAPKPSHAKDPHILNPKLHSHAPQPKLARKALAQLPELGAQATVGKGRNPPLTPSFFCLPRSWLAPSQLATL